MRFSFSSSERRRDYFRDGANSFVIENGWIVAQAIPYSVEEL